MYAHDYQTPPLNRGYNKEAIFEGSEKESVYYSRVYITVLDCQRVQNPLGLASLMWLAVSLSGCMVEVLGFRVWGLGSKV